MLTHMISSSDCCGSSVCDASVRGSSKSPDSPKDNGFVPFGGRCSPRHITDGSASLPIVLASSGEVSEQKPILVKWEAIVARFQTRFQHNFMTSKKAHFDCLPPTWTFEDKVVDGARIKWCTPLMLDAILYLSQHYAFDLSKRRSFNQHRVLFQCIWETVLESLSAKHTTASGSHASLVVKTFETLLDYRQECHSFLPSKASRSQCSGDHELPLHREDVPTAISSHAQHLLRQLFDAQRHWLQLDDASSLPSPWHNLQYLRDSILEHEPNTKSHRKFHRILQQLCGHGCWAGRQSDTAFLASVYERVVFHALLYFHTPPPGPLNLPPPPTSSAAATGSVATDMEAVLHAVLPQLSDYHRDLFVHSILPHIAWAQSLSAPSTTATSLPSPSTTPTPPPRKKQRVLAADAARPSTTLTLTLTTVTAAHTSSSHDDPSPTANYGDSSPPATHGTAYPSSATVDVNEEAAFAPT